MKKNVILLLAAIVFTSCVSKKKYLALEHENGEIKNELTKTQVEKEDLETKFSVIQERVDAYNNKINKLASLNNSKMETVSNAAVISNNAKIKMRETLNKVDPYLVSQAKTLKDSMNLAVSYNLKKKINNTNFDESDDVAINIDETVVMISISNEMLFNTGSYRMNSKSDNVLQKLSDIINSEPSIDVMVEGHTDSRSIHTSKLQDNWDLSVLRATSVVRRLQEKYNVAPEKLIASGRSSYKPLVNNDTKENRAKNRRTRILILPNIDKFFALMSTEN